MKKKKEERKKVKGEKEKFKEKIDKKKIIQKIEHPISTTKTFGQKSADFLSKWAGSWIFIIGFFIFLGIWMATNGYFFLKYIQTGTIDEYPFILLNLVLSCLAAIQAPIILMSQNRQTQRDRTRAEYDYAINRKSEKEIQIIKKQLNRIEEHMSRKRKT